MVISIYPAFRSSPRRSGPADWDDAQDAGELTPYDVPSGSESNLKTEGLPYTQRLSGPHPFPTTSKVNRQPKTTRSPKRGSTDELNMGPYQNMFLRPLLLSVARPTMCLLLANHFRRSLIDLISKVAFLTPCPPRLPLLYSQAMPEPSFSSPH